MTKASNTLPRAEKLRSKSKSPKTPAASMAAQTFQPWPEAVVAVGTGEKWAATMREKAFPLVLGMHTLTFDDVALADRIRRSDEDAAETSFELATWLGNQATAFRALAEFCETAEVRLMCAISRIALERQAAGGAA